MSTTNDVCTTVLSNGLTVITERMDHVRSVTLGIWLKTGARHDAPALSGLSHFVEHMVFKGTTSRTARRISLDIGDLGGALTAFTSHDMVAFYATVLDTQVPAALDLLSDLILNPAFAVTDIEREHEVINQEIKEAEGDPGYRVHDLFMRTMWRNDPLSLPVCGTHDSVGSFTRATLVDYADERFTGHNMVFVAAGNIQHIDLANEVEKHFGRAPAGTVLLKQEPAEASHAHSSVAFPIEQVHMLLGFPAPPQNDARYFTAHLAAMLLGAGPSSRLFQSVRDQYGLAYTVCAEYVPSRNSGYFAVYAITSPASLDQVIRLTNQEVARLKSEPLAPGELQRAKNQLHFTHYLGMETSSARAHTLGGQFLALGHLLSQEERQVRIDSVTDEEVSVLANALFDVNSMTLAVVGDVQGLDVGHARHASISAST
jgi:predicted Zn-dependent peptidase